MFEINLINSGIGFSLLFSFFAGFLSFLSPCVLPIVPPYLAFMAGVALEEVKSNQRKLTIWLLKISTAFVLGLSTVFVLLGLAAMAVGSIFLNYQNEFNLVSGLIILVFGLHFLGVFRVAILYREVRFNFKIKNGTVYGAYALGLAFAFGWTPCIGPVLGTILSIVAQEASFVKGSTMMLLYALGLGFPFILSALFLGKMGRLFDLVKGYFGIIEKVIGVLLLMVGTALITGSFTEVSFFLLNKFPFLAYFG